MDKLTLVVTIIVTLSVASERLVEIIKGICQALGQRLGEPSGDARTEAGRRLILQVLAAISGVISAFLAGPVLKGRLPEASDPVFLVCLGLLASGGSGFWNAVLGYLLGLKDRMRADSRLRMKEAGLLP